MKIEKKYSLMICIILLFAAGIYISGCSSAETTTGKLAFTQGDYAKAEVELKKGLQIDRNDDEAWYMLGYSQIELGKYADARESFRRSLSISNNFAEKIKIFWAQKFNTGITNFNTGLENINNDTNRANTNFQVAINNFLAASNIIPDSIEVYQLIGESYFYLGKKDTALIVFEKNNVYNNIKDSINALSIARVLYLIGLDEMNNRNFNEAIETFVKIRDLRMLPRNHQYYEVSLYNIALSKYRILEDLISRDPNTDFAPHLRDIVTTLELLESTSNNNALMRDAYDLLIVAYDGLDMTAKKEEAERKKAALGN